MLTQTELAWRILEIVALALPAMGILMQVLAHLSRDDTDDAPLHYLVSNAMLLTVGPIAIVGLITVGVIFTSYTSLWVESVALLLGVAFLCVPLTLYGVQRGTSKRYKNIFLPREVEAIQEASEQGRISDDEADFQIQKLKAQQGIGEYFRPPSTLYAKSRQRRPIRAFVWRMGIIAIGAHIFLVSTGIGWKIIGGITVLYNLLLIAGRFVELPLEQSN